MIEIDSGVVYFKIIVRTAELRFVTDAQNSILQFKFYMHSLKSSFHLIIYLFI